MDNHWCLRVTGQGNKVITRLGIQCLLGQLFGRVYATVQNRSKKRLQSENTTWYEAA